MKKKIIVILGVLVVVAALAVGGVYAEKQLKYVDLGNQISENQSIPEGEAAAWVNGTAISKQRFENYKASLAYTQAEYTDEQVLDKMIRQEVLQQEIARLGITVTEEEVKAFNEERFALLDEDETAKQIMEDFVKGLGITMEEYKEQSLEISRESLLTMKYREQLAAEFERQAEPASEQEQSEAFEEYYDRKLDALVEAAEIKIAE